jgi:hypothetical protein
MVAVSDIVIGMIFEQQQIIFRPFVHGGWSVARFSAGASFVLRWPSRLFHFWEERSHCTGPPVTVCCSHVRCRPKTSYYGILCRVRTSPSILSIGRYAGNRRQVCRVTVPLSRGIRSAREPIR